ncbi:MAG: hypothetical protein JWO67_4145 [Streptosporangiaceae bacterium]|jgi:hypothetical protein|nr:hypothetical protein [Streptosporangiaceae bacterium]
MGIPKSMAIAVSGLVFAGGAALTVGAATPANAQVRVAAPQSGCGCGHGGGGCHSRNHHHFRSFHHNSHRNHQRVIVINRNHNFSKSDNFQNQRELQEHQQRHHMQWMPVQPPA